MNLRRKVELRPETRAFIESFYGLDGMLMNDTIRAFSKLYFALHAQGERGASTKLSSSLHSHLEKEVKDWFRPRFEEFAAIDVNLSVVLSTVRIMCAHIEKPTITTQEKYETMTVPFREAGIYVPEYTSL